MNCFVKNAKCYLGQGILLGSRLSEAEKVLISYVHCTGRPGTLNYRLSCTLHGIVQVLFQPSKHCIIILIYIPDSVIDSYCSIIHPPVSGTQSCMLLILIYPYTPG